MCTQIWGLITWWSLLSRRKTDDRFCGPGLPFLLVPLKSRSMFSPCTGSVGILTRGLDSEEMRREAIALSRSFPFYVAMYTYLLPFCRHCFPSLYKTVSSVGQTALQARLIDTSSQTENGDWNLKSQSSHSNGTQRGFGASWKVSS